MKQLYSLLRSSLLIVSFFTAMTAGAQSSQPDVKEILRRASAMLASRHSFIYDADYRIKYFDRTDTMVYPCYHCEVMKAESDTVMNYYARISSQEGARIYDGKSFALIWAGEKNVIIDIPAINGMNFTAKNIRRECIPSFFYSDNPFENDLSEGTNWLVSDTLIDSQEVLKVGYNLPVNQEITFFKKVVYINKATLIPLRIESYARYMDIQDEYRQLDLHNLSAADTLQAAFFNSNDFPADYSVEYYSPPVFKVNNLPDGSPVIGFEALDTKGEILTVDSLSLGSGLILFDFWYLACSPCIQEMKELAGIYAKYKDKGLIVIGLNPFDQPVDKHETLNSFMAKFGIEYKLLFIDRSVAKKYQVTAYPTVYLIRQGKIIYSKSGYNPESIAELGGIIRENCESTNGK